MEVGWTRSRIRWSIGRSGSRIIWSICCLMGLVVDQTQADQYMHVKAYIFGLVLHGPGNYRLAVFREDFLESFFTCT